jgi:hypothetical protein
VHNLQKYLRGIQTAVGNSEFLIWNEIAAGPGIQNAPCRIHKNLRTEFKQRGEIRNSPYGMKQQRGGKFKMLHAKFAKIYVQNLNSGGEFKIPHIE